MARFSRISAMVWGRVNVCIPFLYHTIWGMSRGGFLVLLYNFQHFLLKFRARLIYDTYDTYDIADRYVTSEIFNQFFIFSSLFSTITVLIFWSPSLSISKPNILLTMLAILLWLISRLPLISLLISLWTIARETLAGRLSTITWKICSSRDRKSTPLKSIH